MHKNYFGEEIIPQILKKIILPLIINYLCLIKSIKWKFCIIIFIFKPKILIINKYNKDK